MDKKHLKYYMHYLTEVVWWNIRTLQPHISHKLYRTDLFERCKKAHFIKLRPIKKKKRNKTERKKKLNNQIERAKCDRSFRRTIFNVPIYFWRSQYKMQNAHGKRNTFTWIETKSKHEKNNTNKIKYCGIDMIPSIFSWKHDVLNSKVIFTEKFHFTNCMVEREKKSTVHSIH